jgi:hypothetical protein
MAKRMVKCTVISVTATAGGLGSACAGAAIGSCLGPVG